MEEWKHSVSKKGLGKQTEYVYYGTFFSPPPLNEGQLASREPQATAHMRGDQQITHHTGNLHQKMVGIGWPPKGENLFLTTCKKDTYVESSKHLLWKTLREMRAMHKFRD